MTKRQIKIQKEREANLAIAKKVSNWNSTWAVPTRPGKNLSIPAFIRAFNDSIPF